MTQPRERDGIPTGGQYAATAHAEPDLTLVATDVEYKPAADMSPEELRKWVTSRVTHNLYPVLGWIHMDAADGKDTTVHNASFDERISRLADDIADRFSSKPAGLQQRAEATNVSSEAIWEHMNPLFQEMTTASGDDSRLTAIRWRIGAEAAAEQIGKKVTGPAPVLDGFTAAEQIGKKVTGPAPVLDGFTAAEVEDYLAREQHERQCACDLKDDVCYTESYGEHWRHLMGVPDVEGIFDSIQEMAAARDAK